MSPSLASFALVRWRALSHPWGAHGCSLALMRRATASAFKLQAPSFKVDEGPRV